MIAKPVSHWDFLQYAGLTGSAFLLGVSRSPARSGTSVPEIAQLATGTERESLSFTTYVRIDPAGGITIFNTKPEMG